MLETLLHSYSVQGDSDLGIAKKLHEICMQQVDANRTTQLSLY